MKRSVLGRPGGPARQLLAIVVALLLIGGALYVFTRPTVRNVDSGSCRPSPPPPFNAPLPDISYDGFSDCRARSSGLQIGIEILAGLGGLAGFVTVIFVVDRRLRGYLSSRPINPKRLHQGWR